MEIGTVLKHIETSKLITVLRFVGDAENDGMKQVDNGLRIKGYQAGSPVCQWFDGLTLRTAAFHETDVETVDDSVWEAWAPKETNAASTSGTPQQTSEGEHIVRMEDDKDEDTFED